MRSFIVLIIIAVIVIPFLIGFITSLGSKSGSSSMPAGVVDLSGKGNSTINWKLIFFIIVIIAVVLSFVFVFMK